MRIVASALAALALIAGSTLPAAADPPFAPDADDVVMVGAEISQFLGKDLATLYNSQSPAPLRRMASFDATGSATITIRPGVTSVRAGESDLGVQEMCASAGIDVARSSRPKGALDCADSRFLRFATDEVRWVANTGTSSVTSLTDAQLTGIYNCTITDWHAIDATIPVGTTIKPLIPWVNTEIRTFWSRQVGISSTTLPACVKDVYGGSTIPEYYPAAVAGTPNSIIAFSVARYGRLTAAQKAGTYLGTIPAPDSSAYNRTLYHVVKAVGGVVPSYLSALFGNGYGVTPTGAVAFVCTRSDTNPATTTAGDVIKANGFLELPIGQCGRV
jgi:hypothetical protein